MKCTYLLPRGHVPDLQCAIHACRGKRPIVGAERNGANAAGVSNEGVKLLPDRGLPHFHVAVLGPGRKVLAVGAEFCSGRILGVCMHRQEFFAGCQVPDVDFSAPVTFPTRSSEVTAIEVEPQPTDLVAVSSKAPKLSVAKSVPDLHRSFAITRSQIPA